MNHRRQRQIVFDRAAFDPADEIGDVAPFALRLPLVKVVVQVALIGDGFEQLVQQRASLFAFGMLGTRFKGVNQLAKFMQRLQLPWRGAIGKAQFKQRLK